MDVQLWRSRQSSQSGEPRRRNLARRVTIACIVIAGAALTTICFFTPAPPQVTYVALSGIGCAGALLLLMPDIIPD
jgi:hypothetical protein